MAALYNDPKAQLNHAVFCHEHRDIIYIFPNTPHLASLEISISLAITWW